MKKEVTLLLAFIILLSLTQFTIAEQNNSAEKATDCLEKKIEDLGCSDLTTEQKIFSLLATGKCKSELKEDSNENKCWPNPCQIKTTAQAILALDDSGSDMQDAEEWLLSQNTSTTELTWYLEIESPQTTTCTLTYSNSDYTISINADKEISGTPGSCLSLDSSDSYYPYYLKISPSCYGREFEISCDQTFTTTLLFRKSGSETLHVSEKANSGSAGDKTREAVNSLCFRQGGACDYEGSLWAAMVLSSQSYEMNPFMPYLITLAEDNQEYLPESFLYLLTDRDDYRNDLLSKQVFDEYWDESGDKFYDTAVALYPFPYEEPLEKTNSQNWLLEAQDSDGCWQGNIRNTAFLLYSIWPDQAGTWTGCTGDDCGSDDEDCEAMGNSCMSSVACLDVEGSELSYDCAGSLICCSEDEVLETCSELNGVICDLEFETCTGTTQETADADWGSTCCIDGYCDDTSTPTPTTECVDEGGYCRFNCGEDEEEADYECNSGEVCCKTKTKLEISWWIWLLMLLIILVILGIVFRDKLRPYWYKLTSGFGKSKPKGPPPRSPPGMPRRMPQRRILPPTQRAPMRRPPAKPRGEMDNVLSKLKEMGQ
ncbi:hypothetical protein ACFL0X_00600 [Nanoarchaeota archaeon]